MNEVKKSALVKPESYYSIRQVHQMGVFKWAATYETLRNHIKRDVIKGNNTFYAIKTGSGTGTRYLIKGSTILNLQQEVKQGKVF